jgi:hypothetical protein
MQTTTITVTEAGTLYLFRVIPLTSIAEFIENAGLLVKRTDVALGEEMGWWKVVA